jgi:N-acetylneuraminic acid mutarotase
LLAYDASAGRLRRLGKLPQPLTHATAAALNGAVYVIGGRTSLTGGQTDAVLAVDPATGAAHPAGKLPHPLSDAAAVTDGNRILVIGGRNVGGGVSDEIVALSP